MLVTSLLPLLAVLVFPTYGVPLGDEEAVGATAIPVASCRARGDRTRWRARPNRSTAVPSHSARSSASDVVAMESVRSSAASASATPEIAALVVVPSSSTPAPAPTTAPTGNAPAGDATTLLDLHNAFRARYGASALTWNSDLATFAKNYASKCVWQHSGGPNGENLAAGTGGGYSAASAFNAWAGEAALYDWNSPGFESKTGHFTQLVWKGTTELGCAVVQCGAGTIFGSASTYVICEYQSAGNIVGNNGQYFRDNVGTLQG